MPVASMVADGRWMEGDILKVLLVIDHLRPGGSQQQIINLAIGLARLNHKVTVFTYYGNENDRVIEHKGVDRINVPKKRRFGIGVIQRLRKLIRDEAFDIHCSFLFIPNTYLLLASSPGHSHKTVVSERTFESGVPKWYRLFVRRMFYGNAKAIVVNSEHQLRTLQSSYPLLRDKFHFISNGIMLSDFDTADIQREEEELNVLGVGTVCRLKNPRVVIEALNILKQRHHLNVRVRWVGPFDVAKASETDYYDECRALLEEYRLEEQWTWEGRVVQVASYYRSADIMVHASYGEGFPNVIGEALASGTPVIASRLYDHPKIISEKTNGYLFDPDNPAELADKIYEYHSLGTEGQGRMRAESSAFAKANLANEVMVQRFLELFES
jgi:glycosyltransferase involved in cell wall biosynthesis